MIIPLIAATLSAITIILEKYILSYQKVDYKTFNVLIFFFLFLISLLFFPKFGWLNSNAGTPYFIFIGILMVATAASWNVLFARALEHEKIIEFEIIQMFQPLLTILLGSLIFATERSIYILPFAFIASIALIASRIKKHHLSFDKFSKILLLAVFLMAIEMVFIKILLAVYSPVALYCLRTFLVFLVLVIFFRPKFAGLNYKKILIMAGTAFLAVIQMVLIYASVGSEGLVFTTLVLILTPILIFIFSIIFYHEKFSFRTLLLYLIIIGCIVAVSFFEKR